MNDLATTSSLVSSSVIGTTYEGISTFQCMKIAKEFNSFHDFNLGRGIIMATISTGSSATKPVMYFECAMHARGNKKIQTKNLISLIYFYFACFP